LAAVDLPRHPSQGPLDYAREVESRRRDLQGPVGQITGLYIRLRYGGETGDRALRAFIDQVREFKPCKGRQRRFPAAATTPNACPGRRLQ
jgi:hypothetical protein